MNQYIKQYQKNQIETASQEQILVMLYNGAIQFLNVAKKAMQEKDIEGVHNNIIGAQKIIKEFQSTLDMANGGEIAQNLFGLYEYLNKKLVSANIHKNIDDLDEVLIHMKDLRDTWVKAIEISKKERIQEQDSQEEIQSHDWSVGDDE